MKHANGVIKLSKVISSISDDLQFLLLQHRQPKLTARVTCGTILRNVKMAVNIKDLYGNPGYRFKKISFRRNTQ